MRRGMYTHKKNDSPVHKMYLMNNLICANGITPWMLLPKIIPLSLLLLLLLLLFIYI